MKSGNCSKIVVKQISTSSDLIGRVEDIPGQHAVTNNH